MNQQSWLNKYLSYIKKSMVVISLENICAVNENEHLYFRNLKQPHNVFF